MKTSNTAKYINEWFLYQAFLHPYLQRLHNNITQPRIGRRVGAQQVVFFRPLDNRLGPQAVPFSQGVSISVRPRSLSLAPDAPGGEGRGGGAAALAGSRLPAYVRSESRAAGRAEAAPPSEILAKSGRAPFRREVGDTAKQYLEKGLLVPDHVITRLMVSELETRSSEHWLLDGFPRTLVQAEALDRICDVDLVVSLNIPFETLKDRLSRRWVHPSSGRVYNLDFNPPQVQGVDDVTGEPLVQQEDDKPEAVAARLRRYKDAAKPVIDLYKSRGVLHQFSGTETNKIWPYVYTLFSNKIAPIQSKEAY
ncbi:adenylate kinase 4, mitochondrial isoform X1 [Peromyscus californicus insignis]|uniref:adenylate kinase 4, mitochondrial isoform X1 n=1 Tax=Peromyscus californicus insignis TaxID=564181 RepID=UPI0022A66449|nr:adenylate kinase 4, mitochondrial isoform X1 [Peromyscus californicus insignis]